ncbi:hypothetical protein NL676_013568 [Syzygium grande]|nr:hypothetical protein NL676_013568 [Syzygium grande]
MHGAVFNTDGQPIGLVKDGEYFATHRLSAQEKEHGDTIVKKALANWNDVKEFSGETFSDSMQKNSSSSFPSQVFGGQIESLNPFPSYLAPPIFAAPVGPEAPLANVGSTAVDRLNVLIPPGYHGSTTAVSPTWSNGINLQNAMSSQTIDSSSQMDYAGYDNVLPEGNHVMEDVPSIDLDDLEKWLADNPSCNDMFSKPLFDNDFVRGTSRGVIGWLKIKAVLQWGFFIRKRGVRIVELDQPPIEVRACS